MRSHRLPWGLFLPPLFSLLIAGSVVRYQSVRNAKITNDLSQARQEVSRLAKLLPKGQAVPVQDADHCDGDHHEHEH
jgi:hypothetical protein